MKEVEKRYNNLKNKVEINVNWKIVLVASTIMGSLIFFSIMFIDNLIMYNTLLNEQKKIESNINQINQEIDDLNTQMEQTQSPEFVEKQAREKLKMVRSNETVYIDLSE